MFALFAPASDTDTLVPVVRLETHRHAAVIAAITRERDGAGPALDLAAQRQITARRLAGRGGVSGR